MSMFSWRDEQPTKMGSRYTAYDFEYHMIDLEDWSEPPYQEGYVWLPPANYADYLDDRANRLVVVQEDDGTVDIHDTRNGDVYTASSWDRKAVAAQIYDRAANDFRAALARDLDLDLTKAKIKYWGDKMVLKWGPYSIKFEKSSEWPSKEGLWSLYEDYFCVGEASDLAQLLSSEKGLHIPRYNESFNVSTPPRPIKGAVLREIPETLRPRKNGRAYGYQTEDFSIRYDEVEPDSKLPSVHGFVWIPPIDWDDFLSDHATRINVVETAAGKEIHSPRTSEIIDGTEWLATLEHLHKEACDLFLSNVGLKLGLDLSAARLHFSDTNFDARFEDGSEVCYSHPNDEWSWKNSAGETDWYRDLDYFQESVRKEFPHLVRPDPIDAPLQTAPGRSA